METASKRELVSRIHATLVDRYGEGTPHKTMLLDVIDTLMEELITVIETGDRIELRGFGVFNPVKRRARTARNPKSGERVAVPARNVVVFKPGKDFKARLNPKKVESAS